MHAPYELKLLFATNFADGCFQAIRAVSQMADALRLSVAIAHVGPAEQSTIRELSSFFAEADHYHFCERVQLHGSPVKAISEQARSGGYDLVLAPRSDRLFPRPFHRSSRSALLRSGCSPLWTGCLGMDKADFLRPYRTIAVGIDGSDSDMTHLNLAASFASRVGARLHLLTVVPSIHEGTLLAQAISPEPLSEDVAIERIQKLLSGWGKIPTIDVAVGTPEKMLPRMVKRCDADLLFLSESQSYGGFFRPQISPIVDRSPCSVICVPRNLSKTFKWSFEAADEAEKNYLSESKSFENESVAPEMSSVAGGFVSTENVNHAGANAATFDPVAVHVGHARPQAVPSINLAGSDLSTPASAAKSSSATTERRA